MELIFVTVVLIAISFFLLSVRIIFHKSKKFPQTHVGENTNMKKHGITCAKSIDVGCGIGTQGCSACKGNLI